MSELKIVDLLKSRPSPYVEYVFEVGDQSRIIGRNCVLISAVGGRYLPADSAENQTDAAAVRRCT